MPEVVLQHLIAYWRTRARPYNNVFVLEASLRLLRLEVLQLCQALLVAEQLIGDGGCS